MLMKLTKGFTNEEKYNVYKLTAVVMHMGNLTKDFVPVGKEEQVSIASTFYSRLFVRKCFVQLFSNYSLALLFLAQEYPCKSCL